MRFPAVVLTLAWAAVAAAAEGPGDAALSFLRGLAGKPGGSRLDDSALAPGTPEVRRAEIESRLKRLGRGVRPEDLRVLEQKTDGELAAVLLAQIRGYDAASVEVHAVGLVRRDGRWRPAPLPASFDSTGLSFQPGFAERARELETWMLRARGRHLVRLKDDAFALLRDAMLKQRSPDELHEAAPEKLAADFLAALATRNLPAALALAGGLEQALPPEWEETLLALNRAFATPEIRHPWWRLLAAPEAPRAIVLSEGDGQQAVVSIVALDPAGDFRARPRARAVHLPFVRAKSGLWRVRLPRELLDPATAAMPAEDGDDAVDADLLARLPEKLREQFPPAREATPRAAVEALLAGLRAPTMEPLLARLDLGGEPAAALATLQRAARLWQLAHRPDDAALPLPLDLHQAGDDACVLVQMLSPKAPEKAFLDTLFLRRGPAGWLANPGLSGAAGLGRVAQPEPFAAWLAETRKAREPDWSAGLLTRLGGIPADSAPSEEAARRVAGEWREAIAAGDVLGMLARSACFDDAAGASRLLRNSGYELLGRQRGEILGTHRAGRWTAVSLRVPPAAGDDSADAYPLHVVVATADGPRVLPELDLFDPLTRGRDFLNRRVWDRVAARLPEGARGELEALFEKHRALSAADRGQPRPPAE
jgi:hypothetical protein